MKSVETILVTDPSSRRTSRPAWQDEIKQLHVNFFVLDAFIHQASGFCQHTVDQYATLQKTIADTLEGLLDELEQIDSRSAGSCTECNQLLRKHAVIMRQLNARVDKLVNNVAV